MINIQDINSAIMYGNFNNDQLMSIVDAVKFRRSALTRQAKSHLRIGSAVKFYSTKRNQTFTGTVQKVAIKYITVSTGSGLWKVPANMLEVV